MNGYLFAAYAVIWTILFILLWYLLRNQRQMGKELESLNDSLRKRDIGPSDRPNRHE